MEKADDQFNRVERLMVDTLTKISGSQVENDYHSAVECFIKKLSTIYPIFTQQFRRVHPFSGGDLHASVSAEEKTLG